MYAITDERSSLSGMKRAASVRPGPAHSPATRDKWRGATCEAANMPLETSCAAMLFVELCAKNGLESNTKNVQRCKAPLAWVTLCLAIVVIISPRDIGCHNPVPYEHAALRACDVMACVLLSLTMMTDWFHR